ncbi:phosphoenolpyruvate carboxylase [Roseiconus lacunae]|uniref:phosphoenolpyruvate carboxylase n=1 Tax=Roseiconus lacunae TaxID=2605694 RepID=UPI001E4A1360|nr:phosphoenolpyruvate carboxylase [Roseiconus lacunae]
MWDVSGYPLRYDTANQSPPTIVSDDCMKNPTGKEGTLDHLVEQLDLVVREQVGESLADTMHRIRRLGLERRAGIPDAESRLVDEIERLTPNELRSVIRWLSLFFDLANAAEEQQRIDVLKRRDATARAEGIPRRESIAHAVVEMQQQGVTASEMQRWLDRLKIEPVFTAHPSEAKRRTTRQLLRRVRQLLAQKSGADSEAAEAELLANLTVLWQSDLMRPDRPPVMSEVSRGVYFASTLWDVVPKTYRELRTALEKAYPHHHFEIPQFLAFGTWIGGDRDGHPFVTAEVSRSTFARLRRAALEGHLAECRQLHNQVVMSDQQVPSDDGLRKRIDQCVQRWSMLDERLAPVSQSETYRRFLRMLQFRLEQTLGTLQRDTQQSESEPSQDAEADTESEAAFESLAEFRSDLELLRESMLVNRGRRVVDQYLQPWIDLVDTFGFHFAALDIRQNSEVHRECLREVVAVQTGASHPPDDKALADYLRQDTVPEAIDVDALSETSREVFDTFLLLVEESSRWGMAPIGGYIISMTHSADDVLTVLSLWKTAWAQQQRDAERLPYLPIVPLFETIDDLRNAAGILQTLLSNANYRSYLAKLDQPEQMVMVGYSDSTKDGGYLTACWELHQGQEKLAAVAKENHVDLTVFHGRGGALGRGGGPAARAIRSLPQEAVNGRLRVTEQGEVLSERYDDPVIAHRHLEQIINATLLVSATPSVPPESAWVEGMEFLSAKSLSTYRKLVEHPEFLHYFDCATPIGGIENLPIGSRPARRGKRQSLGDLRAIPWTFAWTQSRHLLPAWFGIGTAVRKFVDQKDPDWSVLRSMFSSWPMFRALIDNAELALAKADMQIAKIYASLISDESSQEIWQMISSEFESSRGAILMIKENHELLTDIEWLRASVSMRNPYVDPLNLSQIHLLSQLKSGEQDEEHTSLLRLSIQGIAGGLRTTG